MAAAFEVVGKLAFSDPKIRFKKHPTIPQVEQDLGHEKSAHHLTQTRMHETERRLEDERKRHEEHMEEWRRKLEVSR